MLGMIRKGFEIKTLKPDVFLPWFCCAAQRVGGEGRGGELN